jgi:hypothetical protein
MTRNCKICLAQHDEQIHAATIRVHEWFRAKVTKHVNLSADDRMMSEGEELTGPQLNAA